MGFRLDIYNDNFCGLIVDYSYVEDSDYFFSGDNVEEAIKYFDLYLDDKTMRLKRNDPNQKVVDKLGIDLTTVDEFQGMLKEITSTLTDEQAMNFKLLIPDWTANKQYEVNDRVRFEGQLYKCITSHMSQLDWSPNVSFSLWAHMLIDPESPILEEWQHPDSTNGYSQGDRIIHKGITYESIIDNNVWEPGTTGAETVWEVVK